MPCARLSDLPSPPAGRLGWPWTAESQVLPPRMADGRAWPRVTVITPSFNQARFIEETLRSVLLQGYPNLEYLVLDGGSTDGSVQIIERYAPWIDFWVSEPDGGQSAAINRGLETGTGEFAAWINSDDVLFQNALFEHAKQVGFERGVIYVGVCGYIGEDSSLHRMHRSSIRTLVDLLRVRQVWRQGRQIVQPEVLFPRTLALDVGALDVANHYSMDYELWGKFFLAGAEFRGTNVPFGMLREHPDQKIRSQVTTTNSMVSSALGLLDRATTLPPDLRASLRADLLAYRAEYPELIWRDSGRLARWGVPRPIGLKIRHLKQRLDKAIKGFKGGH